MKMKTKTKTCYIVQKNIIFNEKLPHYDTGVRETGWVDEYICFSCKNALWYIKRRKEDSITAWEKDYIDHIEYRIVKETIRKSFEVVKDIIKHERN